MMTSRLISLGSIALSMTLVACGGSSSGDSGSSTGGTSDGTDGSDGGTPVSYQVSIQNLTHGQHFSQPVVLLHSVETPLWSIGEPASDELELLAESGSADALMTAQGDAGAAMAQLDSAVLPGNSQSITVTSDAGGTLALSVVSRMESTNDGFTGITSLDLSQLAAPGESMVVDRWAFDAGTQKNLESTGLGSFDEGRPSVPNDIQGSEFNFVTLHPGVVTNIEPIPDNSSQLLDKRKFDNPVVRIRVERL